MKEINEKKANLRLALIGSIVMIIILFITGIYIYKPEPIVIQGEAAADEIRISGKVPGRIKHFMVEEGGLVKTGDTLVVLDSPELSAKLDQANAAANAAIAQERKANKSARKELILSAYEMWQKAETGVDIAKKSYDRIQHLYEKGVISAQKRDEAEAQYKAAVSTSKAAKSQYDMAMNGAEAEDKEAALAMVNRAKGAIQEVEAYINETVLLSPSDGEITEIFPKCGELVGTGAPIMSITNMKDIWFTFNVREDLLGNMKMGSTFTVKIPALNNQTAEVKIFYIKALASYATWKATKATGQFDAKTFEVRARPTSEIKDLRPGMSAIIDNASN